jgi:threonine/homoserine/homoserine lactone efflux protein
VTLVALSTLWSSFLAGALYVLSPGPAVLALVGIGASRGRAPAAWFVTGHLAGDVLWCGLSVVAIVGAHVMSPVLFDTLAIVCAGYLLYLGSRALLARSADAGADLIGHKPLQRGIVFGLTNPKSYPVALAMFTALLANDATTLSFDAMPSLMAAAFLGFLVADVILVWLVGTSLMRALYLRHALAIIRVTGALFIGFAVMAAYEAVPRLWAIVAGASIG